MLLEQVVVVAVAYSKEVVREGLVWELVLLEVDEHRPKRGGHMLGRQLQDFLAKRPLAVVTSAPAHKDLHRGHGRAVAAHGASMKAKRRQAVLSAGVHAPADFDAEVAVKHQVGEFFLQHVFQHGAEVGAVADRQVARVRARARRDVHARLEAQHVPPQVPQDAVHHREVVFHDIRQQEVLALRHAQGLGGVGRQRIEQGAGARCGFVAQRHANAHGEVSGLFLWHHVGLAPGVVSHRRRDDLHHARRGGHMFIVRNLRKRSGRHGALALNGRQQGLAPHGLVQELEPRFLTLGAFAVSVKHSKDGFCDGNQLFCWHPLVKHVGRGGLGAESAGHEEFESKLALGVAGGQDPQIVHHAQSGVGL